MEQKNGRGIFLGVIGVATLVVAIIGATFAYFSASATNNTTIQGSTAAAENLKLVITQMDTGNTAGLIPMVDSLAGKGVAGDTATSNCKDKNGNTVCHVYEIALTNGPSPVTISGTLGFTTYANSNIVYDLTFLDQTGTKTLTEISTEVGTGTTGAFAKSATVSSPATLTNTTAFTANEVKYYYVVVWLHDTETAQEDTDAGKADGYTGTVTFNAVTATGGNTGVTATFSA